VNVIPKFNSEKKPWERHEYNLIGNYPREKRVYDRHGNYNNFEEKYYTNYSPERLATMRKTN